MGPQNRHYSYLRPLYHLLFKKQVSNLRCFLKNKINRKKDELYTSFSISYASFLGCGRVFGSLTHTFSIFLNRKPSAGFLSNSIRIHVALYGTIALWGYKLHDQRTPAHTMLQSQKIINRWLFLQKRSSMVTRRWIRLLYWFSFSP